MVVGALIKVVAQLMVDGEEVFAGDLDAHLEPYVIQDVDIPGAGVAYHIAVGRF